MAKSKNGFQGRLDQVSTTLKRAQTEGEKIVTRIRKEAADLLKKDSRKAVEELVGQAQKLRVDLQKRAERAVRDLEDRGQQIRTAIGNQAKDSVEPIIHGLNLPTRDDVEKLRKHLVHIEKRLDTLVSSRERAA